MIKTGAVSSAQLEAVTYACQQHEHLLPDGARRGFLIGDGAGVGKGRTIGTVYIERLRSVRLAEDALAQAGGGGGGGGGGHFAMFGGGRPPGPSAAAAAASAASAAAAASSPSSASPSSAPPAKPHAKAKVMVWFSINSDLAVDAARDLRDIGAGAVPVFKLGALSYKVRARGHGRGGAGGSLQRRDPPLATPTHPLSHSPPRRPHPRSPSSKRRPRSWTRRARGRPAAAAST